MHRNYHQQKQKAKLKQTLTTTFCPNCHKGTLEQISAEEKKKIEQRYSPDLLPKVIFGCDECKFWCDENEIK